MNARSFKPKAKNLQSGFVLLPIAIIIVVIAAVSLQISYQSSMYTNETDSQNEAKQAMLVAEAGMAHAKWQLAQNSSCSGYANIASTNFGSHSYSASVTPNNGSPVTVNVNGVTSSGLARTLSDAQVQNFQTPMTKVYQLDASGKDTFIDGTVGETNFNKGSDQFIVINSNSNGKKRGLLQFDISDLPTSTKIINATVELYLDTNQGKNDQILIHQIIQDWVEDEATWVIKRSGFFQNWFNQGGDYDAKIAGTFNADSIGWNSAEVSKLVQGWVKTPNTNLGMILLSPSAGGNNDNKFISSDHAQTTLHPKLTINYACECGVYCEPPYDPLGPIAYWKLDETGGLSAADFIGGHDGKLENGPVWVTSGKISGALHFDGVDDQVIIPHSNELNIEKAITISAWIYNDSTSIANSYRIISKEKEGANDNFFMALQSKYLWMGVGGSFFSPNYIFSPNQWYHVAGTFDSDAGEVRMYVDGVELLMQGTGANLSANDTDLYIGSNWQETKWWQGLLDDIRIYDRALTAAEIAELFAEADLLGGGSSEETPPSEIIDGGIDTLPPEIIIDVCEGNFRDEFNTEKNYSGSDGTLKWSTDWLEINETDGPDSGDERVIGDGGNKFALRVRDNDGGGEGVQREVDLAAYQKATLLFQYRRDSLDNLNDYVKIEVSPNGGSSWNEIDRIEGPGSDSVYENFDYNIDDFISKNARIRFVTSSTMGGSDEVYIDNVQIEVSGCAK
jgi:Tfp pilus assembly protein PilX